MAHAVPSHRYSNFTVPNRMRTRRTSGPIAGGVRKIRRPIRSGAVSAVGGCKLYVEEEGDGPHLVSRARDVWQRCEER